MTPSRKAVSILYIKFLIGLIVLCLALAIAYSVSAEAYSLEFIGGPINVVPDVQSNNQMLATVTVRNNGPEVTDLAFRAVSDQGENIQLNVYEGGKAIAAYSVAQFKIEFLEIGPEKVTGRLVIEASNVIPAVEALTLDPTAGKIGINLLGIVTLDTNAILIFSFILGFVLFVGPLIHIVLYHINEKDMKISEIFHARMDGLNWDFKGNWASTFVALSGILGTLVGAEILPENPTILSKQGFQTLSLLFPVLIVSAPFLLVASNTLFEKPEMEVITPNTGKDKKDKEDKAEATPVLISPFVLGSAVVGWAITGELITLMVLFQELKIAGYVSCIVSLSSQILLGLLLVLGLCYVWKKIVLISLTAKKPVQPTKQVSGVEKPIAATEQVPGVGVSGVPAKPMRAPRKVYLP